MELLISPDLPEMALLASFPLSPLQMNGVAPSTREFPFANAVTKCDTMYNIIYITL